MPAMLRRFGTAPDFGRMITDQFDQLLALADDAPLVCGIALHPMVVGQPFRLVHLRSAFEHIARHEGVGNVWFTRPGEIARHVIGLPEGTVPGG